MEKLFFSPTGILPHRIDRLGTPLATTTEIGNSFRDAVCDLLRTKFPDAKVEQRINGTKVDILFSRDDELGSTEVVAVECKDYASPLTKTQISSEIYPQYNNMLESRAVQRVMIVSRKPLGADASAFIQSWRAASHRTYDELSESLLGLRDYLKSLAALQPTGEWEYIETRLEGKSGAALNHVVHWIEQEHNQGLALLGGYGQGKTSFANRLAAHYAARHLEEPASRMPVLIRLGEVVHETQLEALFGKEFTARHQAPGYQFRTLEHLNFAGRLLIILDGFDEMKHAMTAADFQANFREFNRLLVGRAKVLLLGRPNALPSDERLLVFRGTRKVGVQEITSAIFTPWTEHKLAFFTAEESHRLLTSTLHRLLRTSAGAHGDNVAPPGDFVEQRVREVFREVPEDLLRRPVHLLIIAELASNAQFDLAGFNEFSLYEHFIRTLVERDTREKRARRAIALDARLQFQRELAWWAWRRVGSAQGNFSRHDVPIALLADLPYGNASDEEGKRNEYIVSTLTEEKESGVLFFAHRSFQEFLVADRARLAQTTPASHVEYANYLTPDVMAFLRQAPSTDFIFSWYETLRVSAGPLHPSYLDFYAEFPRLLEHIRTTLEQEPLSQIDAWTVYILVRASLNDAAGALNRSDLPPFLMKVINLAERGPAATGTLALLHLYGQSNDQSHLERLVAAVFERCLRRATLHRDGQSLLVPNASMDFAASWIKTVTKQFPAKGEMIDASISFRIADLAKACSKELQPRGAPELPDSPFGDVAETAFSAGTLPLARLQRILPKDARESFGQFLMSRQSKFWVTDIQEKRAIRADSREVGVGRT